MEQPGAQLLSGVVKFCWQVALMQCVCGGAPAQTFTMRVNYNGSVDLPDPSPGPTDDGYIAVAVKSVPQDPLCCTGLNVTDGGLPLSHHALHERRPTRS